MGASLPLSVQCRFVPFIHTTNERTQNRHLGHRIGSSVRLWHKDNAQRSEPSHECENQKCGQGSQECRTRSFVEPASCDKEEGQTDQLNDCDVHADVAWGGFTGSCPSARGVAQSNRQKRDAQKSARQTPHRFSW